jgi:hypothetical protein
MARAEAERGDAIAEGAEAQGSPSVVVSIGPLSTPDDGRHPPAVWRSDGERRAVEVDRDARGG